MSVSESEFGAVPAAMPNWTGNGRDPVRRLIEAVPQSVRFLGVGGVGLATDVGIFTLIIAHHSQPLLARLISLAIATIVTWRLNRAFTFDRSGRRTADEAMRYALVAASAQAISYALFAILVVTAFGAAPQLAVLIGAATAALFSYGGQALFTFRPASRLNRSTRRT
jgi:putative flippase GtrA